MPCDACAAPSSATACSSFEGRRFCPTCCRGVQTIRGVLCASVSHRNVLGPDEPGLVARLESFLAMCRTGRSPLNPQLPPSGISPRVSQSPPPSEASPVGTPRAIRARSETPIQFASPAPLHNISIDLASTPVTNRNSTVGQSPGSGDGVFAPDASSPGNLTPVTNMMRTASLREEAQARTGFQNTVRNLFPNSPSNGVTGASPLPVASPRMPDTPLNWAIGPEPLTPRAPYPAFQQLPPQHPQMDMNFQFGNFGNETSQRQAVTPNPFQGVQINGPMPSSLGPAMPTNISFIAPDAISKDDQLFHAATIVELQAIMTEIKESPYALPPSDITASKIVDEILRDCKSYLSQAMMTTRQAEVDPQLFVFLMGYKKEIVRRMRVLQSRPVESVSARTHFAAFISFMTKYTETKGYGTPFQVEKGNIRKGKNFGSTYRNSFQSNSGNNSNFNKPQYQNREYQSREKPEYQRRYSNPSSSSSSSGGNQSYQSYRKSNYERDQPNKYGGNSRRGAPYDRKERY
jgi:hypothetical protein